MKEIKEEELLKLNDIEKIRILKQICEGKIKYVGGTSNENKGI